MGVFCKVLTDLRTETPDGISWKAIHVVLSDDLFVSHRYPIAFHQMVWILPTVSAIPALWDRANLHPPCGLILYYWAIKVLYATWHWFQGRTPIPWTVYKTERSGSVVIADNSSGSSGSLPRIGRKSCRTCLSLRPLQQKYFPLTGHGCQLLFILVLSSFREWHIQRFTATFTAASL